MGIDREMDEDAYQECFQDVPEAEAELDFTYSRESSAPQRGLYEGQEDELDEAVEEAAVDDEPYIDDLMTGERVEVDFSNLFEVKQDE